MKVNDGTVWVNGIVRDKEQLRRALEIVSATPGVVKVINTLKAADSMKQPCEASDSQAVADDGCLLAQSFGSTPQSVLGTPSTPLPQSAATAWNATAQMATAIQPSARAEYAEAALGRKGVEAALQSAAQLDFGGRQAVTVQELLDQLHQRHHLSIRFDWPTLTQAVSAKSPSAPARPAVCFIIGQGTGAGDRVAQVPASGNKTVLDVLNQIGVSPSESKKRIWIARPSQDHCDQILPVHWDDLAKGAATTTNYQIMPGDRIYINDDTSTDSDVTIGRLPSPLLQQLSAAAGQSSCGIECTTTVVKASASASKPDAAPEQATDAPRAFFKRFLRQEVDIRNVDLNRVSVATLLRHALEALPSGDPDDRGSGSPIVQTEASLFDYLVEDDGLLITTRMKVLTAKETHVYSLKNLKDITPDQLSAVIRQSVRPWSWRSRIDDLGNQLKTGGPRIPEKALASAIKSGIQLATAEIPIPGLSLGAAGPSPPPADKKDKADGHCTCPPSGGQKTEETADAQELALLGDALANGLVVLAHTSLTALEIAHYADPPTGSIQILPGRLIITQSQPAHREIAELLKQLQE